MNIDRIGFIGGGRVTRILLQAFHQAQLAPHIIVHETNQDVLFRLKQILPEVDAGTDRLQDAAGQQVVFLALHPPVIPDTLPLLVPHLRSETVVVSLAPRLTIARISELLDGFNRIVRMIPNAPSIIGKGFNPVAFAATLSEVEKNTLVKLFAALGTCPVVPEEHQEAYAITTAMGPTYLWFQLQELVQLAQTFGLSREDAARGVAEMARGTVDTLFESGLSPEDVMDLVPVKPLADSEGEIIAAYRDKLAAIYSRLKN